MATLLLQTAGAALGSVFGPVGAILGRAAGALAGAAIDRSLFASSRTVTGPRLATARVPSAEEGAGVNRLYGTARIAGTLIWATHFEEVVTQERQGGKGGGSETTVETFSYFANFAIGLCEGPVAGIGRIWADGRELEPERYAIRLHHGDEEQLPDPLIAAKQGDGNAPAYRGLAYVVFERFPLDSFGNRIPLLSFEATRAIGALERQIKAVAVIPGATEHGYSPLVVTESPAPGESRLLNRHTATGDCDWQVSIDQLQAACPNLEAVALVVSWFGTDLRAGECALRPGVEVTARPGESRPWRVSGLDRADAHLLSRQGGIPSFGGTPSDDSVIAAVRDLKARGLKVFLYPFLMMDIPAGNTRPDPAGTGGSQPAYPWRGRITCDAAADKTVVARDEVDRFCGNASASDFERSGGQVVYRGSVADEGYRRFILHYAQLALASGGVDGFILGSEMRGLTRVRDGDDRFPFVEQLVTLASDVKSVLGERTALTYAADWSEYFGYQPQDGSGDLFFNLDPLWMSDAIDAVGIDNYMPLSDWRDTDQTAGNPDGFQSQADKAGLRSQIAAGEGFDWYYASDIDRRERIRTAITDGGGKPWVFRFKDLENWWARQHFERWGGVELAAPTAWMPRAKPFWFTELGCPAIDKGANQPNVFPDAKSSEGSLPYFSDGARSDIVQRRFLEAHFDRWQDADAPAGMVDPSRIFVWAWDARPYPAFPTNVAIWSDGNNWRTGHWLNGRLGTAPAGELIQAVLRDHAIADSVTDEAAGIVTGYVQGEPTTARQCLEPLLDLLQIDAFERRGLIHFASRTRRSFVARRIEAIVDAPDAALLDETLAQEADLAGEALLDYFDPANGFESATAHSRRLAGGSARAFRLSPPVTLEADGAATEIELWLRDHWMGRGQLRLSLPASDLALEVGDILEVPGRVDQRFLVDRIEEGDVLRLELRRFAGARGGSSASPVVDRPTPPQIAGWAPIVHLLDLPILDGTDEGGWARAAGFSRPWRPFRLAGSPEADGHETRASVTAPATLGILAAPLQGGFSGRIDRHGTLRCHLFFGAVASAPTLAVLNGANVVAVKSRSGAWEVMQFRDAREVAIGEFELSGLLRGQAGTEDAMASGADVGAPIALVDQALAAIDLKRHDIGSVLNWRADSAAGSTDLQADDALGLRALLPLSPTHLRARRRADGAIRITWIRRGRFDSDGWMAPEVPLDAPVEAYEVELMDGDQPIRRTSTEVPAYEYPLQAQIEDFGASPREITVRIRQIGGRIAGGLPATARLSL